MAAPVPRPRFALPSPVYPIIDWDACHGRGLLDLVDATLRAGARLLQLRMKDRPTREVIDLARAARERCERVAARLIVNDRADVAKLVGAHGVHLGQDDLPAADARRWLGPDFVIGLSTHSLDQARAAVSQGVADYIGFGPVYATGSKLNPDPVQGVERLREVCTAVSLPVVAIGGITVTTLDAVRAAGAASAAMIGELARATDPEATLAALLARAAPCA